MRLVGATMVLAVLQAAPGPVWVVSAYVALAPVERIAQMESGLVPPSVAQVVCALWLLAPLSSSLAEESHLFLFFATQTLLLLRATRSTALRTLASLALCRVAHSLNASGDKWAHLYWCSGNWPAATTLLALGTASLAPSRSVLLGAAACVAVHAWLEEGVLWAWLCVALLVACAWLLRARRADVMACVALALQLLHHRNGTCFVAPVAVMHAVLVLLAPVSAAELRVLCAFFSSALGLSLSIASVPLGGAYTLVADYAAVPVFATGYAMLSAAPLLGAAAGAVDWSPRHEAQWAVLRAFSAAAAALLHRHHLFVWSVFGPLALWAAMWLLQDAVRIAVQQRRKD